MYKNIYGVQKIPEQDVRSDLDMAVGISSKAATYGKIGNKILPGGGGAIAGATIGAAAGYVQQEGARKEEGIQRKIDQNKNKFIANLSGRSQRQQFYSPIQGGTMVSEKGKKGQYGVNEELVNVEDGELIVNKANGKYNLVKEIKGKKHKIDKEGNIADVQASAPHKAFQDEAVRVVSSIPKMIPGKYGGQAVGVKYSLPIAFKVD